MKKNSSILNSPSPTPFIPGKNPEKHNQNHSPEPVLPIDEAIKYEESTVEKKTETEVATTNFVYGGDVKTSTKKEESKQSSENFVEIG